MKKILLMVLAVILGELVLVLGTTFAQVVLVDGVHWGKSSTSEMLIGGIATIIAAVLSGAVAYLVVKKQNTIPLIVISILITLETTWLISTGRTSNPLWFSILAGLGLIFGVWMGKFVVDRIQIRKSKT